MSEQMRIFLSMLRYFGKQFLVAVVGTAAIAAVLFIAIWLGGIVGYITVFCAAVFVLIVWALWEEAGRQADRMVGKDE